MFAVHLVAAFERVFAFKNEILAPPIAEAQAQPPDVGRRRTEKKSAHVAIADNRDAVVCENLAEPNYAIEFVVNVMHAFNGVIIDVSAVDMGGVVIVKVCVAAECLKMAMRQTKFDVTLGKIGVENIRIG